MINNTKNSSNNKPLYKEVNGIRVYSELEQVPISKINLNDWNPNFVPSAIERAIEDDIKKNGFLKPIILQKHNKKLDKDNVIVDGQHRYEIFSKLVDNNPDIKIPATIIDCHDKTAMALSIRLNREHGDLMPDRMGLIAKEISPNLDLDYLNDILFMPQDELFLLSDMSDNLSAADTNNKDPANLQDSKDYLTKTGQHNVRGSKEIVYHNQEPEMMQGIPTIQCPKCRTHIMLPSSDSSSKKEEK